MSSVSILTEARIKMLKPVSGSNRKFLVIDDFSDMRMAIRRMLREIGEDNVELASNGKSAIDKMRDTQFDVVLCDYNLGDGKDGHQILEEAHHLNYVPPSCIFILITAETSVPFVLGAIECQPDDYITKPFTKELLHHRLTKTMERKGFLIDIYLAMQEKRYGDGIRLAEARLKTKPRYMVDMAKLLGGLYMKAEKYSAAVDFYQKFLGQQSHYWAKFGLGQAKYHLGDYEAAVNEFEGLIEENQYFIEAYDWIAKCRLALGDAAQAREKLMIASAYRAAISYGQHSCFKSAKEYLGMSDVLLSRGDSLKALTNLKEARAQLKGQPVDFLEVLAETADVYRGNNRSEEANKFLKQAETVYQDNIGDVPDNVSMKLAESALNLGDTALGTSIVSCLAENNHDDDALLDRLKDVVDRTGQSKLLSGVINNSVKALKILNKEGIGLAEKGKFCESLELFEKASGKAPSSKAFNLNATLACILMMQNDGVTEKLCYKAKYHLDRVKKAGKEDDRYADLTRRLAKLMA